MDNLQSLADKLNQKFGGNITVAENGQHIVIPKEHLAAAMKELKENTDFSFMLDITAVDFPEHFEVVYHLMNLKNGTVLRSKVMLERNALKVDSVASLWKCADVMERETYDLMGIVFEGHPNLKRILCPDEFQGHPLRKDFKLETAVRQ